MDLARANRVATAAAYQAAEIIRRHFGHLEGVDKKGPIDLVTAADREAERRITATLKEAYPDVGILAEESGRHAGSDDACWVVDPLDGTTNFAHGLPIFAVSIALTAGGQTLVGVVLDPVSGELFAARRGRGASLNGEPIRVSGARQVADSLLATGFAYDLGGEADGDLRRFASCLHASRGIRRLGAAALDLCYVACGRFDGYWERGLRPWDTAAGALIVAEAGGKLSGFDGGRFDDQRPEVVATNGLIHDQMLELLKLEL